jgi:putative ABC transport system substrate-binding protein
VSLGGTFSETAYSAAFGSLEKANIKAVLISDEPEQLTNIKILVSLATNARIPAMYPFRDFADAGGLMAYYIDLFEICGR